MSGKSRRGRPSHLTEEVTERLVELLSAGSSLVAALASLGVPRSTFYDWRTCHGGFRRRVEEAYAVGEAVRIATIASARMDWRSAAWLLEREYPERWALPVSGRETVEEWLAAYRSRHAWAMRPYLVGWAPGPLKPSVVAVKLWCRGARQAP